MKEYNRAIDFVLAAMVKQRQGKHELAAKLFMKACTEASFDKAVGILEASNQRAFELTAKAKAEAAAKKKVQAAEEAEDADLEGLVGDLDDMEAEEEAEEEVNASEPEGEPEEVEDEAIEIENDEQMKFARVLSSMSKKPAAKAKK